MKPEDLYKAMNEIDPKLLEESETYTEKKITSFPIRRFASIAAAAVVVIALGVTISINQSRMGSSSSEMAMESAVESEADETVGSVDESLMENSFDSATQSLGDSTDEKGMDLDDLSVSVGDTLLEVEWEDNEIANEVINNAQNGAIEISVSKDVKADYYNGELSGTTVLLDDTPVVTIVNVTEEELHQLLLDSDWIITISCENEMK